MASVVLHLRGLRDSPTFIAVVDDEQGKEPHWRQWPLRGCRDRGGTLFSGDRINTEPVARLGVFS
ncbi:MAG: hypothetical protein NC453_18200 [Muribaculum sp.]|nr:hypothetical protein [Muribaculum sp.]